MDSFTSSRMKAKQSPPVSPAEKAAAAETAASEKASEKAGNSTLGFHSIYYINMKNRYDRNDAMALQSWLSGVDLIEYPAVEPDMFKDVGMPPSRVSLKEGEKGAWRAHANIWDEILRKKLPPVLILESDATWDPNLREIMARLNKNFQKLLADLHYKKMHNGGYEKGSKTLEEDPWMSEHWDIISFGQCYEGERYKDVGRWYNDPTVKAGKDYWGKTIGEERVVRRSGGIVCTTAYAVSQTGAAKLLLRTATNLNGPADLIVRDMIWKNQLRAYSVMPPVMGQWTYVENIGMEQRGANSDINGAAGAGKVDADKENEAWGKALESGSVWTVKPEHPDNAFKETALDSAWSRVFQEGENDL
ncbi:hypothetical protein RJ55_01529 [Drechmeria coniospora]|nr:hypothetical protein RJ55_01529 [Drechmeria coniospora]